MINGHDKIWVEKSGKIIKTEKKFADEDSLRAAVNNIAQSVGRKINDKEPRLDARLPNGYRIHVVIPPCARNGTTVSIRKFFSTSMTLKDYIGLNAMTVEVAQFLDIAMKLGKNILVSGGTGSGKTTLLGVLCERVPKGQRIIVIEDSTELSIEYEHVVFFETRIENEEGELEVSIEDLLKSSLRLRPDRIIVGEVRGSEAFHLVQAMNTGHKGCLGTVHANTAIDAMVRLEALSQGAGAKISEKALRHQVASAVDLVVQVSRLSDGSRKLVEVSEVLGFTQDNDYNIKQLYTLQDFNRDQEGKILGQIEPTGQEPSFMKEIKDLGIQFKSKKVLKKAA
ncbi:MAG: CpaF family protein [Bdellovibrionales bacterium]|nr:CpaF family protein [Bdellovibrionales bacterium]